VVTQTHLPGKFLQQLKYALEGAVVSQRGNSGVVLLCNFGTRWDVVKVTPRPLYLLGGDLYRRLDGPQSQSGPVWKNMSPPPGFDPRTAETVASHYTDYAIPAHKST